MQTGALQADWSNILRIGKGQNMTGHGDMHPLLSLPPNSNRPEIFISFKNTPMKNIPTNVDLSTTEWTKVEISQV